MRDLSNAIQITKDGIIYKKHKANGTFEEYFISKELISEIVDKFVCRCE